MRSLDVVDVLCIAMLSIAGVAWTYGICHRAFDYDELEHVHAAWLIKNGLRPFRDFFECHPPYLWYPLSVVFRLFGDSYGLLFVCRVLTAVGHVLVLVAIGLNVALSFPRLPRPQALLARTFLLAAVVIAGNQLLLDYLLEFRIDAWPNALLLFAIYRYRMQRSTVFRSAFTFGLLSTLAILCTPKLAVFLAMFVAASLIIEVNRLKRLSAMAAGALAAVILGAVLLLAMGLNPRDVYYLSLSYHSLLNKNGGFGHGLATAIWGQPVPLAIVSASILTWLLLLRGRVLRTPFELAVAGFLVVQLVLVTFRYKQYYGPWFLLGVAFLPYLDALARRLAPLHAVVVAVGILYAGSNALDALRTFKASTEAEADIAHKQWEQDLVPPDGFMAASLEMMPLFRRHVFYHWVSSFAPSGYDTERIMHDLAMEPYSSKFTEQHYEQELEARRPDLIVMDGWFLTGQRNALGRYLEKYRGVYRQVSGPRGVVFVRQR